MPEMSGLARSFCTSPPHRALARWVLLPWALQGLSPSLLRKFPALRLVATDVDPKMVAVAQRSLAAFGPRATAERVDAAALPFVDGRVDVVLSFAMLHHVRDWAGATAEAIRVIRPGGYFVGYDLLHGAPLHRGHHDGARSTGMMGPGQLQALLGRLAVTDVRTQRSAGGFALRFFAKRR